MCVIQWHMPLGCLFPFSPIYTVNSVQTFKALIITEPDVPAEGLGAVAKWVQSGGHLMTVVGAGANDRYHEPTPMLRAVIGVPPPPHHHPHTHSLTHTSLSLATNRCVRA